MYPVLAFVLAKLPALKKRAYVARYLLPLEVPPEFAHEEAVAVRTCVRPWLPGPGAMLASSS